MKKILGAILILSASASQAGHLDVISFTLDESCSFGTYLEIVDDFNEWGEAYGYQAEIAAPLFTDDMAAHYWLGRSADNETFGKAYDAWEAGQADAESVPGKARRALRRMRRRKHVAPRLQDVSVSGLQSLVIIKAGSHVAHGRNHELLIEQYQTSTFSKTKKGNSMNRSNSMRAHTVSLLMLLGVLVAAPAAAQLQVWEDYDISDAAWSVTMVKLDPGTQDIYLEGLKSTWVAANEVAKSLGHIEDYAIYANQAVASGAFDLLLVMKMPNTAALAPSRERYNEFMEAWGQENMDASNEKVLELYNEIREIQGEYLNPGNHDEVIRRT